MALFKRKPLAELSPAYRRRIERAEAQGFTRSQARGHATKKELSITEERLAELPDNKSYLLKMVKKLKNPEYTAQYNAMMKAKTPQERDRIAMDLAHKIANDQQGGDIYPVHTWKGYKAIAEEEEEDIDIYEEY